MSDHIDEFPSRDRVLPGMRYWYDQIIARLEKDRQSEERRRLDYVWSRVPEILHEWPDLSRAEAEDDANTEWQRRRR